MTALPETAVAKHRVRRIMARSAGHSAARMRSGPAQIESLQRHPIVRRTDHRASAEQLIEAHLAVEDVSPDEPEPPFEIERRMDLPPKHRFGETRRMSVHRRDDRVRGQFALIVPASPRPQVVAKMLAEQARDMSSLGREA